MTDSDEDGSDESDDEEGDDDGEEGSDDGADYVPKPKKRKKPMDDELDEDDLALIEENTGKRVEVCRLLQAIVCGLSLSLALTPRIPLPLAAARQERRPQAPQEEIARRRRG